MADEKKETRKPTMKVGQTDKNGWKLEAREQVGPLCIDVWASPKRKKFVIGYATTDLSGKVEARYDSLDKAIAAHKELVAKERKAVEAAAAKQK